MNEGNLNANDLEPCEEVSEQEPQGKYRDDMKMSRVWAMPSADTFDIPPIAQFVKKYLYASKVSIDPFARNKRWATYTNDLNPDTCAESHMDVMDFLKSLRCKGVQADLVIFDPPYSPTQIKMSYDSIGIKNENSDFQRVARWSEEKRIIQELMLPTGVFLQFGWNSYGMSKQLGFSTIELLLVCHGAGHNDTICLAERKVQYDMLSELREDQ